MLKNVKCRKSRSLIIQSCRVHPSSKPNSLWFPPVKGSFSCVGKPGIIFSFTCLLKILVHSPCSLKKVTQGPFRIKPVLIYHTYTIRHLTLEHSRYGNLTDRVLNSTYVHDDIKN